MSAAEQWLPVVGYEGFYEVSDDLGRVRSVDRVVSGARGKSYALRGRLLAQHPNHLGYMQVGLCREGVRPTFKVHRLLLLAFVGPAPDGMEGCHNDGDPLNNTLSNLRWDTHAENAQDILRHGRHPFGSRTHCSSGHEYTQENTRMEGAVRRCRECSRAYCRKRRLQMRPAEAP